MTDSKKPDEKAGKELFKWIEKASEAAGSAIKEARKEYQGSSLKDKVAEATTQVKEFLVDEERLRNTVSALIEEHLAKDRARMEGMIKRIEILEEQVKKKTQK